MERGELMALPYTTNLVAHYEGDLGLGTTGTDVDTWADQSGTGNDMTDRDLPQTTTTPQGVAALSFDGTADHMVADTPTGLPTGAGARTFVLVASMVSSDRMLISQGGAAGLLAFQVGSDATGNLAFKTYNTYHASSTALSGEGWKTIVCDYDGTDVRLWLDGTLVHTETVGALSTNTANFQLARQLGGSLFTECEIAAVLVYGEVLSDANRQSVETYLDEKFISGTSNIVASYDMSAGTLPAGLSFVQPKRRMYHDGGGFTDAAANTPIFIHDENESRYYLLWEAAKTNLCGEPDNIVVQQTSSLSMSDANNVIMSDASGVKVEG